MKGRRDIQAELQEATEKQGDEGAAEGGSQEKNEGERREERWPETTPKSVKIGHFTSPPSIGLSSLRFLFLFLLSCLLAVALWASSLGLRFILAHWGQVPL